MKSFGNMSPFLKSTSRTLKTRWLRFVLTFLISFICVLLSGGIGYTPKFVNASYSEHLNTLNMGDLIVRSASDSNSFSNDFISYLDNEASIKEK